MGRDLAVVALLPLWEKVPKGRMRGRGAPIHPPTPLMY